MSNGNKFRAKFNTLTNSISGLKTLIQKFYLFHKTTIVFEYIGQSHFLVSIYDYNGFDSLKEVTGEFILYSDSEEDTDIEFIDTSSSTENASLEKTDGNYIFKFFTLFNFQNSIPKNCNPEEFYTDIEMVHEEEEIVVEKNHEIGLEDYAHKGKNS